MTTKPKPGLRRVPRREKKRRRAPTPSAGKAQPAAMPGPVSDFHAHIYFHNKPQRRTAEHLRRVLITRFGAEFGMRREVPGGPHPVPMVQLAFGAASFGIIIPWLMLHRKGLDVLVHPITGDDRSDHDHHALWLGQKLPIDFDRL